MTFLYNAEMDINLFFTNFELLNETERMYNIHVTHSVFFSLTRSKTNLLNKINLEKSFLYPHPHTPTHTHTHTHTHTPASITERLQASPLQGRKYRKEKNVGRKNILDGKKNYRHKSTLRSSSHTDE